MSEKIYRCPICNSKLEKFGKYGIKFTCPKCSFQILRESKSEEEKQNGKKE